MQKITDWEKRLRKNHLRVTRRRLTLLSQLAKYPHITAEELFEICAKQLSITRQGIYVNLAELTAQGLVRRIDIDTGASLYEVDNGDNHHHSICTSCNKLEDIDCALGAAPCLEPAGHKGFVVQRADVTYFGICADCV